MFVTTKTDRRRPEDQAVTPEPNVLLKSPQPFLRAIRTHQRGPPLFAAFFNGRPVSLTGPPLGLYHPIFSKFKRLATEMEAVGLTSNNDLKFANELIQVSAQFYAHENDRRTALRPVLGKLLGVDLHADEWIGANLCTLKPDGACLAMTSFLDRVCFLYWEAKREIGEGGCDPIDQASEDYALTVAHTKYDEFRPYLAIGGAVFLDRPTVDLLTPLIPLRYQTTVPWRHLTKIGDHTIEYQERLRPTPSRSVFRAKASRNDKTIDVIVKFTSRYCREAHDLVAEKGAAPKLWHCGWDSTVGQTVVMYSYVSQEFDDRSRRLERDEAIEILRDAVETMHKAGYVHGDLREPNILLDGNNAPIIIDFDWAGRTDNSYTVYPSDICLDPSYEFHKDVCAGGRILAEHDDHLDWSRQALSTGF
ncbi:hypothetical protein BKA62DRAFT_811226 [Auriculariales sp. MPI-PUGE-AT-0066]|nr:hypothetical protein BKA62DRAFT_811226 [Auriculariales sp. MPI-PUGE-AT-0066]